MLSVFLSVSETLRWRVCFFAHHQCKKCLEFCRQSLKSEVKRMTVTARGKHSNPREDMCVL